MRGPGWDGEQNLLQKRSLLFPCSLEALLVIPFSLFSLLLRWHPLLSFLELFSNFKALSIPRCIGKITILLSSSGEGAIKEGLVEERKEWKLSQAHPRLR